MEQVLCSRVKQKCKANGSGCSQLAAYRWLYFSAEEGMDIAAALADYRSCGAQGVFRFMLTQEELKRALCRDYYSSVSVPDGASCGDAILPQVRLAPAEVPVSWSAPEWRAQQSGKGFNQTQVPAFRGCAPQCWGQVTSGQRNPLVSDGWAHSSWTRQTCGCRPVIVGEKAFLEGTPSEGSWAKGTKAV